MLHDSASTMRGLVTELETKLQLTVAPHVIDIDGKPCHHMKKSLWKILFCDVSTEFKFSLGCLDLL